MIEHITKVMTLEKGDVILTGTPSGVGPVREGDRIQCGLEGEELLAQFEFEVEAFDYE